jgi:hypothetical protein
MSDSRLDRNGERHARMGTAQAQDGFRAPPADDMQHQTLIVE